MINENILEGILCITNDSNCATLCIQRESIAYSLSPLNPFSLFFLRFSRRCFHVSVCTRASVNFIETKSLLILCLSCITDLLHSGSSDTDGETMGMTLITIKLITAKHTYSTMTKNLCLQIEHIAEMPLSPEFHAKRKVRIECAIFMRSIRFKCCLLNSKKSNN